jgi:Xaa-Pro aminopeptidase
MEELTSEKALYEPLLPKPSRITYLELIGKNLLSFALILGVLYNSSFLFTSAPPQSTSSLTTAAWKHLSPHTHLLSVPPIPRSEFLSRQKILTSLLKEQEIDAFISEPSASSTYYANISASYELSERPFLQIFSKDGGFSYLAPKFEVNRIKGLEMVGEDIKVIQWGEEEDPFEVLKREIGEGFRRVMLDEHARWMIASGLSNAGIEVLEMSLEVKQLRSVKTDSEITILRAVNKFTLELIRALQKVVEVGVSQETIFEVGANLFAKAGIGRGYWAIVLFGEGAANPHGGSKGVVLKEGEFVLIDIGSVLHGYGSDVTRTILPRNGKVSEELMGVWKTVQRSQAAAGERMRVDESCRDVDGVARKVITDEGFGEFFTHRLGHGLGLEMHEHPYLNGANGERLKVGEVVTNEPVSFFFL